jgi:hypothetical protein
MEELLIKGLTERVERLERECGRLTRANRRWKRLSSAVFAGALAFLSIGADQTKVVEAEQFVLKAPDGTRRGTIEVDAHGSARVTLVGGGHKGQSSLYAHQNGASGLQLTDEKGQLRLWANLQPPDGNPALVLRDEGGQRKIVAEVLPGGANFVGLIGRDGNSKIILLSPEDSAPVLRIFGRDGKPVLELPKP